MNVSKMVGLLAIVAACGGTSKPGKPGGPGVRCYEGTLIGSPGLPDLPWYIKHTVNPTAHKVLLETVNESYALDVRADGSFDLVDTPPFDQGTPFRRTGTGRFTAGEPWHWTAWSMSEQLTETMVFNLDFGLAGDTLTMVAEVNDPERDLFVGSAKLVAIDCGDYQAKVDQKRAEELAEVAAAKAAEEEMRAKGEASIQLTRIGKLMRTYYIETASYPVGTGPLSADCCAAGRDACPGTDPGEWTGVWEQIDFRIEDPHKFRYSVESTAEGFEAHAIGGFDCDHAGAVDYVLTGTVVNGQPTLGAITVAGED